MQRVGEAGRSIHDLGEATIALVERARRTRQPVRLTDSGDNVAVVLDAREFEALQERLAMLQALCRAQAEVADGQGIPHEAARARALAALDH